MTATPVNHTVETVAYTLESNAETVIFIGDTGATEAIWAEANQKTILRPSLLKRLSPTGWQNWPVSPVI